MSSEDIGALSAWASTLLTATPVYLAYLVAILVALIKWNQDRVRSATTLVATLLMFTTDTIASFVGVWLPLHAASNGDTPQTIGLKFGCLSVSRAFLHAVCFGLLIYAIFSRRKAAGAAGAAESVKVISG